MSWCVQDVLKMSMQQQNESMKMRQRCESRWMNDSATWRRHWRTTKTVGERLDKRRRPWVMCKVTWRDERFHETDDRYRKDISSLQDILRRRSCEEISGTFSIISWVRFSPERALWTQYRFKSGEVVDAVIRLKSTTCSCAWTQVSSREFSNARLEMIRTINELPSTERPFIWM